MKKLAHWLLIIGGINYGLVGLLDYDAISQILGDGSSVSRAVFVLVGLSAVWVLVKKK